MNKEQDLNERDRFIELCASGFNCDELEKAFDKAGEELSKIMSFQTEDEWKEWALRDE